MPLFNRGNAHGKTFPRPLLVIIAAIVVCCYELAMNTQKASSYFVSSSGQFAVTFNRESSSNVFGGCFNRELKKRVCCAIKIDNRASKLLIFNSIATEIATNKKVNQFTVFLGQSIFPLNCDSLCSVESSSTSFLYESVVKIDV